MIQGANTVRVAYALKLFLLKVLINSIDHVPWQLCLDLGKFVRSEVFQGMEYLNLDFQEKLL